MRPQTTAADAYDTHHGIAAAALVPGGEVAALDDLPAPTFQEKAELLEALVHEPDVGVPGHGRILHDGSCDSLTCVDTVDSVAQAWKNCILVGKLAR